MTNQTEKAHARVNSVASSHKNKKSPRAQFHRQLATELLARLHFGGAVEPQPRPRGLPRPRAMQRGVARAQLHARRLRTREGDDGVVRIVCGRRGGDGVEEARASGRAGVRRESETEAASQSVDAAWRCWDRQRASRRRNRVRSQNYACSRNNVQRQRVVRGRSAAAPAKR